VDERPKTSRGTPLLEISEGDEQGTEKEEEQNDDDDDDEPPRLSTSTNQTGRMSKFIEGSMNERSFGIASSWFQDDPADDDKPLPLTPPTKHVTFSCTPVRESLDEGKTDQDGPTTRKKERRGLRKSISNFNFQSLSEKMKIFGGSSSDVSAETGDKKSTHQHGAGTDLMNERKRKADAAYAAQFGFKKQKFSNSATATAPTPDLNGHREHAAAASQEAGTIRSSRRSVAAPFRSPGLRRKKSRRELEQENAELRARLAQQDHHPSGPDGKVVHGKVVLSSPGKRPGKLGNDMPPMSQIPGRGVLKVLENGKRNSTTSADERRGETLCADNRKQVRNGRQQWEWPEDVF
jgi:hypothetical protein